MSGHCQQPSVGTAPLCTSHSITNKISSIIIKLIAFFACVPQAVFLADFKQIKKVQCLSQSDGKALLNLDVEGARQVSATTTPSAIVLYTVLKIGRVSEKMIAQEIWHRPFFPFLIVSIDQRGHCPYGREHDGPYWWILPLGKWNGCFCYLPTK